MQEIKHEQYYVSYNPETGQLSWAGSLRLRGADYAPILSLMKEAITASHPTLTLDVSGLKFLNSSGINTLSKFVIGMRKQPSSQLVIKGSSIYPWQKKSLKNLQRLLPNLQLNYDTAN